jgi:NAD-dependent SIR2 family protein deacetylase
MKPDIVFFGEGLPEIFHESMAKDKDECDLLIVIGSSLKVRPVALIPSKCIYGMASQMSPARSPECLQLTIIFKETIYEMGGPFQYVKH